MTTPQADPLIEEAKRLRKGIAVFEAAQRATLDYLVDLIEEAYHGDDLDMLESATEAQDLIQQDVNLAQKALPEVDALIAGRLTPTAFVQRTLPKMYPQVDDEIVESMDADVCIELLRTSCRGAVEITQGRAENVLESGLALILPASFEERARQAIKHAKEALALLTPSTGLS